MRKRILKEVISMINQQLEIKSSLIVSICGGSCTRKSSLLATYLTNYFKSKSILISQDQFQLNPSYISNINPDYKFDHPDNFAINDCYEALIKLKKKQIVEIPNYNFTKEEVIIYKTVHPAPVIIFEGLYTNFGELQKLSDISIYAKSHWYTRMIRRVLRNTLDRYKGREASIIFESFCNSVTMAHLDFIKLQEESSNFIIETPLEFDEIINYYNLKPVDYNPTKNDNFFTIDCDKNISFKINNISSKQYELLFFYKNKQYLKMKITNELADHLKKIDWLAY